MSLLILYWTLGIIAALLRDSGGAFNQDYRTDVGRAGHEAVLIEKLPDDNPIAFHGEAGYQADLLMPGWHFKLWIMYAVEKYPWVQVRAERSAWSWHRWAGRFRSGQSRPSR